MLKPLRLLRVTYLFVALMSVLTVSAQTDVSFDVVNGYASQYSSYAGQTCNVTLTGKTLTANEYAGVCFPFTATTAQLNATFGEGNWSLYQYDSYADNKISFKSTTSVTAGEPYIIKVKTTTTDPKFDGVTFAASIPNDGVTTAAATTSSDPSVKGYYFKLYSYQFVNGQAAPYTAWWIGSDGSLGNQRNYGEFPYKDTGYEGAGAYIFSPTMNTAKLALVLDGKEISSGGNSGGTTSNKNANLDTETKNKIAAEEQLTDVPTVYLTIPDVSDLDKDLVKDRQTGEALYHQASIKVVDANGALTPFEETSDFLQIKVRGNSTASPSKRAYRLKFAKKHKHDLLGAGYTKRNWTLLANVFDRSLIRNAVTYHLGKAIGMPFNPGYQFVDLVINGDYRGCYQISDQVEADADRVNVNEDTGWMFEFQGRGDMLDDPSIKGSGYMVSIKNPDTDDYTTTQVDSLKTKMTNWLNRWTESFNNYTGKGGNWREYNNEESIAKFYIDTNITGDYDGMMTVKTYLDADSLLYWGPIWDKDLAYANCTYDPGDKMIENVENASNIRWFFINVLNKDKDFVARLKYKMDKLTSAGLYDKLAAAVDQLGKETAKTWALNFTRWKIEDAIDGGIDKINPANGYKAQADYLSQLKSYLKERISFVQNTITTEWTSLGSPVYTEPRAQKNASVPTIYIDAPTIGDEWAVATKMEVLDKDNLLKLGTDYTNAAFSIQYQGTGKAGKKNSYRIKFDKKQAVFGGSKYKQWVLLSNTKDPSLVRNALTKELGDGLGMAFTPRYQFVDLYLNDTYLGTYQVTDRVKAEDGRALVTGGDKDNDWLLELDDKDEVDAGDLYVEGDDTHPYINIKNPDQDDFSDDVNAQHKATIGDWFNNTFWTDIENHVDQTSFINWYIASEVLGDYKQFSSIYAYKSNLADTKLFFGPLWGNEKAYANNSSHPLDMSDLTTSGSYKGLLSTFADNGVWKQKLQELWKQEWFKNGVNEKWTAVKDNLLTTLQSKLNDLKTAVSETQADNFALATDDGAGWTRSTTEDAEIKVISDYLTQRFAYLTAKFADMKEGKAMDYVFDPSLSLADSKLMDYNNVNVNITIQNRTLEGGVWNTFCLPFNASEAEMKAALGCDYELSEHTSTTGNVMNFTAPTSKQVKHGVPYLIKPAQTTTGTDLVFKNVTISYKEGGKDQTVSFDNNAHQFKANINHVDLATDGTNLFLGPKNQLYKATAENYKHDGIRCYFVVPSASAAKVNIAGDNGTTRISQINGAGVIDNKIYNLAGQRVSRPNKGVYIKNGKKYVIK